MKKNDIDDNMSIDSSINEDNDRITIYDEDLDIDNEDMMQIDEENENIM